MADSGTPNDGPPLETTQQGQLGDVEEDREHMVGMSDQLRRRLELVSPLVDNRVMAKIIGMLENEVATAKIVELEADAVKIQKCMDELAVTTKGFMDKIAELEAEAA
ncbi:hypothetical protein GGH93_006202 [Coemansia aciculifera]|nr:hypothetical protein GGH93_006202 [Coemansia aciculifera]